MPAINSGVLTLYDIAQRSIAAGESLFSATVNPVFAQNVWYDISSLEININVPEGSVAFLQFQSSINPDEPYGEVVEFEQRFVVDGSPTLLSNIMTYLPATGELWNHHNYYFPLSNIALITNLSAGNHEFKIQLRTTTAVAHNPDHSEAKHIVTIMKR